jgi:NADPH:quinone reductase-like Zn-dependent oxidoreductase
MPDAVVMTGYGPPEVLTWAEVPPREPGAGQIRIKVKAARQLQSGNVHERIILTLE